MTTSRGKTCSHAIYLAVFILQIFETKANQPKIVMTILESGYLLVLQGQESLVRCLCDIVVIL